jgi:uncharacterized protein YdhG (YjbR/CyaY superfamily)
MEKAKALNVNDYIAGFPLPIRKKLKQLRSIIKAALPGSEEKISYAIPAYRTGSGFIIYFSGFKNHIGLYPAPAGSAAFNKKIAPYRQGKSTIRFLLDEDIPADLVTEVVKLRVKAMNDRKKLKKSSKS